MMILLARKTGLTAVRYFANINQRRGDAMPTTELLFYQAEQGDVPVLDWLESLAKQDR